MGLLSSGSCSFPSPIGFWDYWLATLRRYQSQYVSGSKPRREKMPHAVLCVCGGKSAPGKKAPCRVEVLCRRVLRGWAVSCPRLVLGSCLCSFPSPIGFGITG
eukprot:TRINITY_DN681_c0_g6_i2.p1 TRINITY_DN681_c0_g6~~TRINITY_DN681_c0_g6_i2.p1  ORF type:complete len:103 (-),score=2.62 TRINITY_DN681_c0_g6_i2:1464-1772(-)